MAAKQKELKEKLDAEKEQEVEEVEQEEDSDDDDEGEAQGATMNGGDFHGLDNKKLEETGNLGYDQRTSQTRTDSLISQTHGTK